MVSSPFIYLTCKFLPKASRKAEGKFAFHVITLLVKPLLTALRSVSHGKEVAVKQLPLLGRF